MTKRVLVTVPGGGSPRSDVYRPVYDLVTNEGIRRGFDCHLIDFVGCGHSPEEADGLDLKVGVERFISEMERLAGDMAINLFARSFGCNIVCRALALEPGLGSRLNKVILWGPSPFHTYWALLASDVDSLERFNRRAANKGLRLSPMFWAWARPIEEDIVPIIHLPVLVVRGSEDNLSTAAFNRYLAAIVRERSKRDLPLYEVAGAGHEVGPQDPDGVISEYFRILFGNYG